MYDDGCVLAQNTKKGPTQVATPSVELRILYIMMCMYTLLVLVLVLDTKIALEQTQKRDATLRYFSFFNT